MPPKENRKGRDRAPDHEAGIKTPRAPSAAPSKAGSEKHAPAQKKAKHVHADANKENHHPNMTESQLKRLAQMVIAIIRAQKAGTADNALSTELQINNASSDEMDKTTNYVSQSSLRGRKWSNYPIPLPPRLNASSVRMMREKMKQLNNKIRFTYCGAGDLKNVNWEMGVLQCYDGVTENRPSNFLSCDFVNPKYLKEIEAKRQPTEKEWQHNRSCFVYAPVGTILSTASSKAIDLSKAQDNWKTYAANPSAIPGVNTPECAGQLKSHFWLYTEEFVDYENQDKNQAHQTYKTVHNKGRIGMLMNIEPIQETDTLKSINVASDHIGWGRVRPLGGKSGRLQADFQPMSWHDLQEKIGRYILLTNIWSSNDTDPYKSVVDTGVLKAIYMRVYEMTTGEMVVNVRRESGAYGRLCVIQKKMELSSTDEEFGLPRPKADTANEIHATDLYATRIFMSGRPFNHENEFTRTTFAAHDLIANNNLIDEEKKLCGIFQMFHNKALQNMKNQAYRDVMVAYWNSDNPQDRTVRRADTLPEASNVSKELTWDMPNAKAMLVTMLLTSYNVLFQRLPFKVACPERYVRFLEILKHYRYWFEKSKCMADEDFVEAFQKKQIKLRADASQFTGMFPELAAAASAGGDGEHHDHSVPIFGNEETAEERILLQQKAREPAAASSEEDGKELTKEEKEEKEAARLLTLQELFPEPVSRQDYLEIVTEKFGTPTGKKVARDNMKKFITSGARWGEENESFSERLAKIQNW